MNNSVEKSLFEYIQELLDKHLDEYTTNADFNYDNSNCLMIEITLMSAIASPFAWLMPEEQYNNVLKLYLDEDYLIVTALLDIQKYTILASFIRERFPHLTMAFVEKII